MIIKMNIFNFYFLLLLIEFSASIDKIYRINIGLFNPKDKESDSNFILIIYFLIEYMLIYLLEHLLKYYLLN